MAFIEHEDIEYASARDLVFIPRLTFGDAHQIEARQLLDALGDSLREADIDDALCGCLGEPTQLLDNGGLITCGQCNGTGFRFYRQYKHFLQQHDLEPWNW